MAPTPSVSPPEGEPLEATFSRLFEAASGLPGVERSTSYGTPSLKVGGKSFCRVREAGVAVVFCPLEEKELLIEQAPGIYFETDHYRGWPAVLVRTDRIGAAELALRLRNAWRMKAPKRLLRELDAAAQSDPSIQISRGRASGK